MNHQGGFTLIQMIVALFLISLMVLAWTVSTRQSQQARVGLKQSSAGRDMQESFTTAVAAAISHGLPAGKSCRSFKPERSLKGLPLGNTGSLTFTKRPRLPGKVKSPRWLKEAIRRCRQPRRDDKGTLYFCLAVKRDKDAPRNSFLEAPFAEVRVDMMDFVDGRRVPCDAFTDPQRPSTGMGIHYSLYWGFQNKKKFRFLRRHGTLHANRVQ